MKNRRQRRILEIVSNETIGTQKELAERLQQEGFETTQATISRDIKELLLVKVNIGGDRYKYVIAQETPVTDAKLRMVLREFILSYDYSENLLILNTAPGNANTVASAIDRARWPQVIGTLAGDDTVMLVIKPKEAVQEVVEKIEDYTSR
ncbi:MAG: arginine repressor [Peptococcaceae bacterium]|jgi:transcriptional regulator of arginine metabolism|nr:arginine repressor [Peptococcaceae bacterium]MEE0206081.1 arginine repressor [Peptococcaceae bacterium]